MVYKYLGYGVTDSNGVAKLDHDAEGQELQHSYTGIGAGEIDVVASLDNPVSSGSIVSETFSVWDYLVYDDGHTGQASNKWWNWSSYPATVVRGNSYTSITSVNEVGYYNFDFRSFDVDTIEFDVYKTGGARSDILFQLRDGNMGVVCQYALSSFNNLELNNWYTVKIDLKNGTITIGNQTLTYTPNNETQFCLRVNTSSEVRLKEFKMTGTGDVIRLTGQTVMQTGDNNVLSATLYEGGAVASGKTVTFYKNGVSVGTDTTNSSGVASYTYEGTGAGELEFTASSDNIVSEIYEVFDCLKYDDDVTPVADSIWTLGNNGNAQLTRQNGYTNLSEITLGTDAFIITQIVHSCAIEFDAQVISTGYNQSFCQIGQSANATTILQIRQNDVSISDNNWHHFKFTINGDGKLLAYIDNSSAPVTLDMASTYDPSSSLYFRFRTSESAITEINFKGFKVYSI